MKANLFKTVFSLIFICFATGMNAQFVVSGTVKDANDGTEIPGATIIEKGTINGTITDIDGSYTLTVSSENDTLIFSYIGYKTLEIPIFGRANLEIILESVSTELNEVVVIGYGTQKKKVVTGAIATVDASRGVV